MKNKSFIKDMAKDQPVKAIQALTEVLSDYAKENKTAHENIIESITKISDSINSVEGNGDCIVSRLRGLEDSVKTLTEGQPKDEHSGELIERRTEPPPEPKKEKFKDLPIDRKMKTIVLWLTLFSLVSILGASFLGFGEDMIVSIKNRFFIK